MDTKRIFLSTLGIVFLVCASFYVFGDGFASVTINAPTTNTIIYGSNALQATIAPGGSDANVTFYYSDDAGSTWTSITTVNYTDNNGIGTVYNYTWDTSAITAGTVIKLNATAWNATEISSTAIDLTVDNENPGTFMTVKRKDTNDYLTPGSTETEYPELPYGTELEINCSHLDTVDSNGTTKYFSVYEPENSFGRYRNISTHTWNAAGIAGTTPSTAIIEYTETKRLGYYVFRCTSCDTSGNCNKTDFGVEVVVKDNERAGHRIGPTPSTRKQIGNGNTENIGDLTSEGTKRLMSGQSTMKFNTRGEEHSLTVTEIGKDMVKVRVQSEPIELELAKDETKTADVDGDGKADIEVTLNGIFSKKAEIEVKELEAPPEEPEETEETEPTPEPVEEKSNAWIWIILIVIIVIAVIAYFGTKKKK